MIGPQVTSDQLDGVSAHQGFPNPALDSSLDTLDLNRFLVHHPAGSFFMRIAGDDWQDIGIFDGDIVIVDRVISAQPNDIITWWEGESFVIGTPAQLPKDTGHWGVVTTAIHQYQQKP